MKKLMYLVLAIPFFLASCGSETVQEQITGEWTIDSKTRTNCIDPDDNSALTYGDDGCIDFFGSVYCFYGTMDFTDAGSVAIVTTTTIDGVEDDTETNNGTYTIDEEEENVEMCFDGECNIFSITFSGNTMTRVGAFGGCDVTYIASK